MIRQGKKKTSVKSDMSISLLNYAYRLTGSRWARGAKSGSFVHGLLLFLLFSSLIVVGGGHQGREAVISVGIGGVGTHPDPLILPHTQCTLVLCDGVNGVFTGL